MSSVHNTNSGPGTFNNVHHDQYNYIAGAIIISNPSSTNGTRKTYSPAVEFTIVSERYQDIILNTNAIFGLLNNLKDQSLPQDDTLQILCFEVEQFARAVAYVMRALDIIDTIPGELKSLHRFGQVKSVIRNYGRYIREMHGDIVAFQNQLLRSMSSDFFRSLFLCVRARYRWMALSTNIKKHLNDNRRVLDQFLHLLATRSWRKIISDTQGQALEKLVIEAGLQPDHDIRHLQMLKILVRDHLGRSLPIPLELCTSLTDFEIVVKHYCRGVEGSDFIQQNNWEIVRATDNAVIDRSKFMSMIKPEMELDISIVLQMLASSLFLCPGCAYDNPRRDSGDGWINCYNCDTYFRVVSNIPLDTVAQDRQPASPAPRSQRQHKSATIDTGKLAVGTSKTTSLDVPDPPDVRQPSTSKFVRVSIRAQQIIPRSSTTNTSPNSSGTVDDNDTPLLQPQPQGSYQQDAPTRYRIIPPDDDMRRLMQECYIAGGNASLLSEALVFTKPENLKKDQIIKEFYAKCRASQELIYAQIPWASAGAERSRQAKEQQQQTQQQLANGNVVVPPLSDDPDNPNDKTPEERLLDALLAANTELADALQQYEEMEQIGKEREVEDSSRREARMDRRKIPQLDTEGNNTHGAGGSSRPHSQSSSSSPPASIWTSPPSGELPGRPHHGSAIAQPYPRQRPSPPGFESAAYGGSDTITPRMLAPPPAAPRGPRSPAQSSMQSRSPSSSTPAYNAPPMLSGPNTLLSTRSIASLANDHWETDDDGPLAMPM